jgi:putative ABC transport system ATP-binding protein
MTPTNNDNDIPGGSALLKLSGIRKVHRTRALETEALSGVHLEIRRGEYVAIEGPSGSGKTTLLSILGLLDVPSAGEYLFQGRPVTTLGGRERARLRNREIGFIFQSFNLIGELSVWENVELPLSYRDLSAAERTRRVEHALERVQMSHRRKYLPHELSGGQQQRVAVARAVAGDPAVLLADEPTGSLDSKNGELVMGLLDELFAGGATICMVTHNPDYCRRAGRRIQLFDGRVVDDVSGGE